MSGAADWKESGPASLAIVKMEGCSSEGRGAFPKRPASGARMSKPSRPTFASHGLGLFGKKVPAGEALITSFS